MADRPAKPGGRPDALALQHLAKLGPGPLPHGRKTLERLQLHLDAVHVLDAELKRRYAGGSPLAQPLAITDRQAAALRRRLLADLAAGRRTINDLIHLNDRLGEQQAVLNTTHAFAIFASQYGHAAAVIAFRRSAIRTSLSWQSATPHLPTIAQAAADVSLRYAETHDRLDEITTMNTALESTPAL